MIHQIGGYSRERRGHSLMDVSESQSHISCLRALLSMRIRYPIVGVKLYLMEIERAK